MKISKIVSTCAVFTVICFSVLSCGHNSQKAKTTEAQQDYLKFPSKLTPQTPYDVDMALEQKLLREGKLPEAQRLIEILSWQMFISLNWLVNQQGKPMPEISDNGNRIWETWKESFEIFKEDGSAPLKWGSRTEVPDEFKNKINETGNEDVLFRTTKFSTSFKQRKWKKNTRDKRFIDTADEINQAFTSPIWDQNGNIIRYEIRLNKPDVDY